MSSQGPKHKIMWQDDGSVANTLPFSLYYPKTGLIANQLHIQSIVPKQPS